MKAKFSPLVQRKIIKLHKIDKKLVIRINKQIRLLESNPKHHSLRTHKLSGNLANRWSISIDKGLRMVYLIMNDEIAYFVDIGTHDEVYRK